MFLSHFDFIFLCGVRVDSNFIGLPAAVQLPQYHLLMRLCLFPIFQRAQTSLICRFIKLRGCTTGLRVSGTTQPVVGFWYSKAVNRLLNSSRISKATLGMVRAQRLDH